jgi:hypothetical protein
MTFSAVSNRFRTAQSRTLAALFDPLTIRDCVMWFDASDAASVQIGTGVSAWSSAIAANAITATQITANNQPAYQLGQQAGRNAIYFDGSNDQMTIGDRSALFPSAASVVVAYRPDADANYQLIRTHTGGNSYWQTNFGTERTYIQTFKGSRINNVATTIPTSGNTVVSITSSSSAYRVYVRTSVAHDVAGDFSAGTAHAIGPSDGGDTYKGWIYEILYFSRALSASEVTILNSYLSWKWRI